MERCSALKISLFSPRSGLAGNINGASFGIDRLRDSLLLSIGGGGGEGGGVSSLHGRVAGG